MAGLLFIIALIFYIWGEFEVFAAVSGSLGDFGPLFVIAATILTAIMGMRLFRRAGAGTMQRLAMTAMRRESPLTAMADGGAIIAAAGLLLLPGFITDFLGLVLFVPGLRTWLALTLMGRVAAKTQPKPPPDPPAGGGFSRQNGDNGKSKKNAQEVIIEGEFERKE